MQLFKLLQQSTTITLHHCPNYANQLSSELLTIIYICTVLRRYVIFISQLSHNCIQYKAFPPLQNLLLGLRLGELTVLSGATGVGKTTFVSQMSLDFAEQGVRLCDYNKHSYCLLKFQVQTLFCSYEILPEILLKSMLIQHCKYVYLILFIV
jgi:hypothetical protein